MPPAASAAVASSTSHGLLITGTIGAGKSSVAAEIGDVLQERGVPAAVIDLDWLGWTTTGDSVRLMWKNLAAVWANYLEADVGYAVMARLIQSPEELNELKRAVPGMELTVVRLDSPSALVEARLRGRDSGRILEEHLRQTVEFVGSLEGLGVEDLVVTNGDVPIRSVAEEVLAHLGWI